MSAVRSTPSQVSKLNQMTCIIVEVATISAVVDQVVVEVDFGDHVEVEILTMVDREIASIVGLQSTL